MFNSYPFSGRIANVIFTQTWKTDMKKLGVLTTVISLFLLFALTACETQKQRYANAILDVFEQIDDVKKERSEKYPEGFKPHESNDFYYSRLYDIDLTDCPEDFQEAFLKYLAAYYRIKKLVEEYDNNAGLYKFADILSIGASSLGLSDTTTRWDKKEAARAEMVDIWIKLKQVGLKYGAQYKSD